MPQRQKLLCLCVEQNISEKGASLFKILRNKIGDLHLKHMLHAFLQIVSGM